MAPVRRRRSRATPEELSQQEAEAEARLDDLQARLGLRFKRRELLREAMTHTSWINERGDQGRDNERLEYLGDAVLELVAGEYLFNRFPSYDEGQLTQMRSSLVSTVALARLGEQLLLGETLRLGRGAAKSGARRLTSLHANAFEALVGAIFLDQGYRRAGRVFLSRIEDLSAWTDPNFKGRLQALAQERFGAPPQYRTVPASGDPRTRQYVSQVSVEGQGTLGEGRAGTKQAAEQAAARAAIDLLVAPVSKKRRRRSRTAGDSPVATASAAETPAPVGPQSPDEDLSVVPTVRRRRRRSTAAITEAVVASPEPEVAAQALGVIPGARRRGRRRNVSSPDAVATPGATDAVQIAAPVGETPVTPPSRRRRRRSSQATANASEPALLDNAAIPASAPLDAPPAPRRRRRRSSSVSSAAASPSEPRQGGEGSGPDGSGSASAQATAENPADPPDGSVKRRTHRGHRGGRRRSGRSTTPEP